MPTLTDLAVNNRSDVPKTINTQFQAPSYIQEPTNVQSAAIPQAKIVPEELRGLQVNQNV